MADYADIGLDEHLQSTTGPVSQQSNYISNTQADSNLESLPASQITQGVITTELRIQENGKIVVYNGTVPQVLIGYDLGGF